MENHIVTKLPAHYHEIKYPITKLPGQLTKTKIIYNKISIKLFIELTITHC